MTEPAPAELELLAGCPPGCEDLLEAELAALGAAALARTYGGVFARGPLELIYAANLRLRTASRVQRVLARAVHAPSERALGDAVAALDLRALLRPEHGVEVELHDSAARGPEIGTRARALAERAAARLGARPRAAPTPRTARLVVHRHNGVATIGLDTSGKALHKRGYRSTSRHEAPLQETLAAAVLLRLGYSGAEPLLDPFCGSGTLAIEGAYVALDKAPLIHRKRGEFAFEHQLDFDYAGFRRVQEAARAARKEAPPAVVAASDRDLACVREAAANAGRARVGHFIRWFAADARGALLRGAPGLVVGNLPYGARLGTERDLAPLYRAFGARFGADLAGWRAGLLAPEGALAAALNLPGMRHIPLRNGALRCVLAIGGGAGEAR